MSDRPLSVRSRRTVDRELAHLRDRFGTVPVESRTVENDPEFFQHGLDVMLDGYLAGAGAFVTDDDDRAVFIRHERAPDEWTLPAGGREAGEHLGETAARETFEEAGVRCTVTDCWGVERKRIVLAEDPERRYYLLHGWFDARATGGDVGLHPERWEADEEILAAEWFDPAEPPAQVGSEVADRVARWSTADR